MSMLKHLLFSILPSPQKLNERVGQRDLIYRLGYGLFCLKIRIALAKWHHRALLQSDPRTALAKWHRKELLRCDPEFAVREAELDLIKARIDAQSKGISAPDPRYPSLEVKIEKWW